MIKRLFDFSISFLLAILLSPVFLIVSLMVRFTSKGPTIHWSKRIGQNNIIFKMPKFRTMKIGTPQVATHLLQDPKEYLTPVGNFLRKTSLDELPQLYSVLTGDMSLVGPRPALFNQIDLRDLRTKFGVQTLKPGITGWAQINGRDDLPIPEKVEFDMQYLHKQSLIFDVLIIFKTAYRVVGSKGVHH